MKQTRKKPKAKRCKVCTTEFLQYNSLVVWCSPKCGLELSKLRTDQQYVKKTKQLKREYRANNRSYQMRKAQDRCNEYIRLRDGNFPCISCGTTKDIQYAAGHWKSIGSHPSLRWHFWNINRQCNRKCNKGESGNAANYRLGLIEKIGLVNVEWLEGPHESQNLSLDDIKDINVWYKDKINYLENEL